MQTGRLATWAGSASRDPSFPQIFPIPRVSVGAVGAAGQSPGWSYSVMHTHAEVRCRFSAPSGDAKDGWSIW